MDWYGHSLSYPCATSSRTDCPSLRRPPCPGRPPPPCISHLPLHRLASPSPPPRPCATSPRRPVTPTTPHLASTVARPCPTPATRPRPAVPAPPVGPAVPAPPVGPAARSRRPCPASLPHCPAARHGPSCRNRARADPARYCASRTVPWAGTAQSVTVSAPIGPYRIRAVPSQASTTSPFGYF
ncbi:vegetative cell wall protein gp1-like [Phragmites australis]|uniref:vegetative cell wall protein gp1-like n=1 Tax=Phragmites australis TaxID=29695 RepID=UPI002D779B2E|nr:vegetative cell wall protein gp1-like [Phragmites australis]